MAANTINNPASTETTSHTLCCVIVGYGKKTEERMCSLNILERFLKFENAEAYRTKQLSPDHKPIRIYGSPGAFDAAIWLLGETRLVNMPIKQDAAIELVELAWSYESEPLQRHALNLCQVFHYCNLRPRNLIYYHSVFLKYNLWTGIEHKESELLEEISRRGAEVLNYLSGTKKTSCFDTVKKILQQFRLNVFKEKDVFDRINAWRNNIAKAVEEKEYGEQEFVHFEKRWKAELLSLIQFKFFSVNEANEFFDEEIASLTYEEKVTLFVQKGPLLSGMLLPETNNIMQLPVLTYSGADFFKGGLNLYHLSKWRGNFIPLTERTMFLTPMEVLNKSFSNFSGDEQNFRILPVKMDLYLLSVRLYNLQDLYCDPQTGLVSISVAVIREETTKAAILESQSFFKWRTGQPLVCTLKNPCLLRYRLKYRIEVTNTEDIDERQTFFQPARDGQMFGDMIHVFGSGNICGLSFAIAKDSDHV